MIRTAIDELLDREGSTPYELVADLVVVAAGGPKNLSVRTGERFRRLLAERDANAGSAR